MPLLQWPTSDQFGRGSAHSDGAALRALEMCADIVPVPVRESIQRHFSIVPAARAGGGRRIGGAAEAPRKWMDFVSRHKRSRREMGTRAEAAGERDNGRLPTEAGVFANYPFCRIRLAVRRAIFAFPACNPERNPWA